MKVDKEEKIIGFYASFNFQEKEQEKVKSYLWGNIGLDNKLESLKWHNYGKDFHLILFQFYVKPIPDLRSNLRNIESYRKKEKSIGIPVIIDDNNFFDFPEKERMKILAMIIISKLDLLKEKIKRNKLDLKLDKLKTDVDKLLND